MSYEVNFYVSDDDESPVEEFLDRLDVAGRKKCLHFLELLRQQGLELGEPYCKCLQGTRVWELRPECRRVQYRILYGRTGVRSFTAVHIFQKRGEKHKYDPEIAIAEARLTELEGE